MSREVGIGVGLIGTGFMGKCHALAYNAVSATFGRHARPRLELLADLDLGHAREAAASFGFARASADWRQVVEDPRVELVSIATPNALHREIALAALAAGKHVWCEKPMALTLAEARAMAEAAAERPRQATLLGYNYLRNPLLEEAKRLLSTGSPALGPTPASLLEEAKRLLSTGAIGIPFHFRGTVDEDYMADPSLPWSWRCRVAEAGLGTLGDLTVHLVSVARFLLGEIDSLTAEIATVHRERPLPDGSGSGQVENEDLAQALLRFESGATGLLASSRVAWGRKNFLTWEVQGSHGLLRADQERMNELSLFLAEGPRETQGFRRILAGPLHPPYGAFCPAPGHGLGFNDLKVIEAEQLLAAIAAGRQPSPNFSEGLKIEAVVHAMVRSAASRTWVSPNQLVRGLDDPSSPYPRG